MDLPAYDPAPDPMPELVAAMGGDVVESLRHPAGYTLFVYRDAAAVAALSPDFSRLAAAGDTLNIATAPGERHASGADVVSRVFAPAAGVPEDPVTGSAHCVLTPYWARRLGRDRFRAYQASTRGGHVDCALAGDRVELGGACITVTDGLMRLPD